MFDQRHDFTLRLELLTDLHIGDGATALLSEIVGKRLDEDPQVRTVVRDQDSLPWLPPTSLKGAIRRLEPDTDNADQLFGRSPGLGNGEEGQGGQLILWGGRLDKTSIPHDVTLPRWDANRATFITTHVRIDRAIGCAEDGKLFFEEAVAAGCCFDFDACFLGTKEEVDELLVPLLSRLAAVSGFELGAAGDGRGMVRLVSLEIAINSRALMVIDGSPEIRASTSQLTIEPYDSPADVVLVLSCPGPFLLADPTRDVGAGNALAGLLRTGKAPELLGSSLIGVMRNRASWLQQTRMGLPADDPNLLYAASAKLTPCQGLFGVAGLARKLRIRKLTLQRCGSVDNRYPGIALDDFTQAAIFGALFEICAPADLEFIVELTLGSPLRPLTADEQTLFEHLVADAVSLGWQIGHSTGTGFGWFTVERVGRTELRDAA